MKTNEIRKQFLNYFKQQQHTEVPGSSLVPHNDPTLLFTNAGMVQFKDVFTGQEKRPYKRATTVQPCVRAGGKHNDLEQVGFTARHHTFFEMLGNFSFGDYFKREAIQFAWEFLTSKKWLGLDPKKLWITVYQKDDEAADIWIKEIGIDKKRFSRCGEKDNFWAMGDTGPCGPCSEIFYEHEHVSGEPPGSGKEGDRFVEIWNLVFMQFNRDEQGHMTPLPKPSVDTGMGLERIAAVMQGVHNNYDIDIFKHLISEAAKLTHCKDLESFSLRVIADHIRACAFLIADGIIPSNEGRGYVLRRIIRRAVRHGHKLGIKKTFFYQLVNPLINEMGSYYQQLEVQRKLITDVLFNEEQQFEKTLDQGLKIFETTIKKLKSRKLSGEIVFKLYDTYGFPLDLTEAMAKERGLSINQKGFERKMQAQRQQAKSASKFQEVSNLTGLSTEFVGYETLKCDAQVIKVWFVGNKDKNESKKVLIVLNHTPFYPESGGQKGDEGHLKTATSDFIVTRTFKLTSVIVHEGEFKKGEIKIGDTVTSQVDKTIRKLMTLSHSATHLLHAALRKVLGNHVVQKGSYVGPYEIRFDFSHFRPVLDEELQKIEDLVNEKIQQSLEIKTSVMSPDEAVKQGAMALFGEKYGDQVRVVQMGDFSKELCGGTHAHNTGDIKQFKIIKETAIAAGIRRIEATVEKGCDEYHKVQVKKEKIEQEKVQQKFQEKEIIIKKLSEQLKEPIPFPLKMDMKALDKLIDQLQMKWATVQSDQLINQAIKINDIYVLAQEIKDVNVKGLRDMLDQLKNKLGSAVIVLATVQDGRVHLVAGVTKDLLDRFHAGELMQFVAKQIGGQGGGRADMAQGGSSDSSRLLDALKAVKQWVSDKI